VAVVHVLYCRFHNANNFFSGSRFLLHVLYLQKLDNEPYSVKSAVFPYLPITGTFCTIEIPFFASFCFICLYFSVNDDRFYIKKAIMPEQGPPFDVRYGSDAGLIVFFSKNDLPVVHVLIELNVFIYHSFSEVSEL
jgi:hypothetical protein